jgi:DNA-binding transcriptional LysR family regulator
MQIDSLKVFCDVVENKSFTKAAKVNGVTQSAISQQISVIERAFKSRLVERSKKRFRLTNAGQVFYDHAKNIVQSSEALHSCMDQVKKTSAGNIRVATIYSIGLHELPPYVKKFMQTYPAVNLQVEYRHSDQVYEDVLGNVVDLGLVAYPAKNHKLEIIPHHKETFVLICNPDHPFAALKNVKLKMLAGQKFVGFVPKIPTRIGLDKIFRKHGAILNIVAEFDNIETVKGAVEIGEGISVVPQSTITQEVATRMLAAVPLENGAFYRPTAVIHKKKKMLSPAMKQFLELLKEEH